MMGTGEAEGEDRAAEAAEAAISNPLLDDYCLSTANGAPVCSECVPWLSAARGHGLLGRPRRIALCWVALCTRGAPEPPTTGCGATVA